MTNNADAKNDGEKTVQENVTKDLELSDEDAEKVGGGDAVAPPPPRFDPYKNFKFH